MWNFGVWNKSFSLDNAKKGQIETHFFGFGDGHQEPAFLGPRLGMLPQVFTLGV